MPKIIVVRPDMTEEEREKRVKEFENTLSGLLKCKVSLKSKSREFIPYNIQREVYKGHFQKDTIEPEIQNTEG